MDAETFVHCYRCSTEMDEPAARTCWYCRRWTCDGCGDFVPIHRGDETTADELICWTCQDALTRHHRPGEY